MILEYKNQIAIRQRTGKDIWQDLYEFPLIETAAELTTKYILQQAIKKNWLAKNEYEVLSVSPLFKQQLSHQLIAGQFIRIQLLEKPSLKIDWLWQSKTKMSKYAFPQFINQYLKQKVGVGLLF